MDDLREGDLLFFLTVYRLDLDAKLFNEVDCLSLSDKVGFDVEYHSWRFSTPLNVHSECTLIVVVRKEQLDLAPMRFQKMTERQKQTFLINIMMRLRARGSFSATNKDGGYDINDYQLDDETDIDFAARRAVGSRPITTRSMTKTKQ